MRFKTFVELTRKPKVDRFKGSLRKASKSPNEHQGPNDSEKSDDEIPDILSDKLLN